MDARKPVNIKLVYTGPVAFGARADPQYSEVKRFFPFEKLTFEDLQVSFDTFILWLRLAREKVVTSLYHKPSGRRIKRNEWFLYTDFEGADSIHGFVNDLEVNHEPEPSTGSESAASACAGRPYFIQLHSGGGPFAEKRLFADSDGLLTFAQIKDSFAEYIMGAEWRLGASLHHFEYMTKEKAHIVDEGSKGVPCTVLKPWPEPNKFILRTASYFGRGGRQNSAKPKRRSRTRSRTRKGSRSRKSRRKGSRSRTRKGGRRS
jgi:hypothetical protein